MFIFSGVRRAHVQYDVIVIGGGPAGCAAAITMARAGKKVCILEKFQPDRDKSCGDGLMPDAQRMLDKLGVLQDVKKHARNLTSARFYPPHGKPVEMQLSFLTIPRAKLDQILRDHAAAKGVHVEYGVTVKDVHEDTTGVIVENHRASYAIIATGTSVALAKKLGLPISPVSTCAAIRGYHRIKSAQFQMTVFFLEDTVPGYAWIFPISDTEANIGVGYTLDSTPPKKDLKSLLKTFLESPSARDILEGEPRNVIAAPIRSGLRFKSSGTQRVLLCGENLDTTLPFLGEGVGKALLTGVLAAESITEGNAQENYQGKLQTLREVHNGYAALHGACCRPIVKTVLRSPFLTNIGVSILNTNKGRKLIAQVYNEQKSAAVLSSRWSIVKNLLF
jgi:geranylgeranyl reductase family protein